jgi:hypothetical protein
MTNLDPNNIVFVGIEIRLPAEDRAGDFLFVNGCGGAETRALY